MRFKFIDGNGQEQTATGLASLLALTRQGVLTEETLVFDETEARWRKAREIDYLAPATESQPNGPRLEPDRHDTISSAEATAEKSGSSLPELKPDNLRQDDVAQAEAFTAADSATGHEQELLPDPQSVPERESTWYRLTRWTHDGASCAAVAWVLLGVSIVLWLTVVADFTEPDAAEKFGELLGKVLVNGVVLYFLCRRWGGQAFLIISLCLFCAVGYVVQSRLIGTSARTHRVMTSFMEDLQSHTQAYSAETLALKVPTLFEILDGKLPYQGSDLAQMQTAVALAEKKTDEFRAYFENRVSRARQEIAAVDPDAEADFMRGIDKTFPRVRDMYAQRKQYFEETDALLSFLLQQSGPFEVRSDGIHFKKGTDAAEYNRRIDRINEHVAAITEMQRTPSNGSR